MFLPFSIRKEMMKMYNQQYQYPNYQQMMQQYQQPVQQPVQQRNVIQGKVVDSLEVAKSIDIALDGSLSVFPLADNSAVVLRKLNMDGTSMFKVFKPVEIKETKIEYVTKNNFKGILDEFTSEVINNMQDDIKDLKKEVKGLKK